MNDNTLKHSFSVWNGTNNISVTPQNAVEEKQENTEEELQTSGTVRVYIKFLSELRETNSLEEQIEKVQSGILTDSVFKVRRKDQTGYGITADVSLSQYRIIAQMPYVESVSKLEEEGINSDNSQDEVTTKEMTTDSYSFQSIPGSKGELVNVAGTQTDENKDSNNVNIAAIILAIMILIFGVLGLVKKLRFNS